MKWHGVALEWHWLPWQVCLRPGSSDSRCTASRRSVQFRQGTWDPARSSLCSTALSARHGFLQPFPRWVFEIYIYIIIHIDMYIYIYMCVFWHVHLQAVASRCTLVAAYQRAELQCWTTVQFCPAKIIASQLRCSRSCRSFVAEPFLLNLYRAAWQHRLKSLGWCSFRSHFLSFLSTTTSNCSLERRIYASMYSVYNIVQLTTWRTRLRSTTMFWYWYV